MKKMTGMLIVLVMIFGMSSYTVGSAEEARQDGITWFISTYGYTLSESMVEQISTAFEPVTFDCDKVQVTLEAILYDGVWMYTSAILTPTSSEDSLILPDDAEPSFPVSGTYGEKLRDDPRTFIEAAIEDGKQLIRVMAVPQEFYEMEYFICASRQDAVETSTMVCATPCDWRDEVVNLSFHVDVTIMEPTNKDNAETAAYDFPITVKRIGDIETAKYHANQEIKGLPYETITLIKTPVTVYAFWENGTKRTSAPANLADASGTAFTPGVPADGMTTFDLTAFPSQLSVNTEQDQEIIFCAEGEIVMHEK